MTHLQQMIRFQNFIRRHEQAEKMRENRPTLEQFEALCIEHIHTQGIRAWLIQNLYHERSFKQPQLYIHGPKYMGKTSLINWLTQYFTIYTVPMQEEFYDDYEDGLYDIAVLDEFKAHKTIQWLNQWLEGAQAGMSIRQKGSQTTKHQNIPTIILSNYDIYECYPNAHGDRLDTLIARLEIVPVYEPIMERDYS